MQKNFLDFDRYSQEGKKQAVLAQIYTACEKKEA
jgi:hypothetical protein